LSELTPFALLDWSGGNEKKTAEKGLTKPKFGKKRKSSWNTQTTSIKIVKKTPTARGAGF